MRRSGVFAILAAVLCTGGWTARGDGLLPVEETPPLVETNPVDAPLVDAPPTEVPASVSEADFAALRTASPFLRSLDLSQSLILTGIAKIEGDLYATLLDRETKASHVVSRAANSQGWRMVAVAGDEADLETVTAQIAMASGEVFAVRFDEQQLKPGEGKPGAGPAGAPPGRPGERPPPTNYRENIPGDGFRGPPPPELIAKLDRLDERTRERVFQQMRDYRERNPGAGGEERRRLFGKLVDQAAPRRRR